MTDILCNWLNSEVRLSTKILPCNFAREFSSGFLLGELLHKFGLQNDFDQFSQNCTSEAKINNFTRIEPNLHLLDVSFDTNIAREVMTEKQEAATKLLYELFIALNKKQKNNLTGVAMETMRPSAPQKLGCITSTMYRERLRHLTPRQTDISIDALMTRFHEKQQEMEKTAFGERLAEEERRQCQIQEQRLQLIRRLKENREETSETMAKILAATVTIPKPPPNKTDRAIAQRKRQKREIAIEQMMKEIDAFDKRMKLNVTSADLEEGEDGLGDVGEHSPPETQSVWVDSVAPDDQYVQKLKKNSAEMKAARLEREKRRRKVLFEQMCAHEAQEEERRESILVNQLMRQSIQERRVAVQLLHTRHEKQVICNNRLMREKQFEEFRKKEFQLALEKEAEVVRLATIEQADEIRQNLEHHNRLMAERAREKYERHYCFCAKVVSDLVDLVCKCAEYRELTNRLIPERLMRDWMNLFIAGQPQYIEEERSESVCEVDDQLSDPKSELSDLRNRILDESDLNEYRLMIGEWMPPEGSQIACSLKDNKVLGHVIYRLYRQVYPDPPPREVPQFQNFKLKACILGKSFSGKTTLAGKLIECLGLEVLSVEKLLNEAIEAFQNKEVMEEEYIVRYDFNQASTELPEATSRNLESGTQSKQLDDATAKEQKNPDVKDNAGGLNEEKKDQEKPYFETTFEEVHLREVPTVRAQLGERAVECLNHGGAVDDETLVCIIVDGIRRLPEDSCWALDGFPVTYCQLMILERLLTGYVSDDADSRKRPQLVSDPHPPLACPHPRSGFDVTIALDLPDDTCLKRSTGWTDSETSDRNSTASSSDEGLPTMAKQLPSLPPCSHVLDKKQIQYRLAAYADEWPHLECWFSSYGCLFCVDASLPEHDIASQVMEYIEEIIKKIESSVDEAMFEELIKEEEKIPEVTPIEIVKPAEPVPETSSEDPKSKASPKSSQKSQKSPKDSPKGQKPSKEKEKEKEKESKKGGKGKKEPRVDVEPTEPTGPPPPQPGSNEWVFVAQPIEMGLACNLVCFWETSEGSYMTSAKDVFHLMRVEREQIIRYLYQTKMDFRTYLCRPDLKQEFVTQWQKNFNEVSDDLRDDNDMKADLHQRVDDLRERLWNISDERKEQSEKERSRVMSNGWLDDHTGILSNHYISLMQVELDIFQDSVHILRDYYRGMEGRIPDETSSEFTRIPLLEILPAECVPGTPPKTEPEDLTSAASQSGIVSPVVPEIDTGKKSGTPVGKKKKGETPEPVEEKEKKIIPLVSRRPVSPETTARSKVEKGKAKPGKEPKEPPEEVQLPQDPDDRLIHDACTNAVAALDRIISAEAARYDADAEAERQRNAAKDAEKKKQDAAEKKKGGKAGKGDKADKADKGDKADGKKGRSPSPKKGKGGKEPEETPTPAVVEENEEEMQKKVDKEKGRQEYFAAIMEEAASAKCRMHLIRCISAVVLQELKSKAAATYNEMNDLIGEEFLQEIANIDQLSEVIRNAIETSSKLCEELNLCQRSFVINRDAICFSAEDANYGKMASPHPSTEAVEESTPDVFTVSQLRKLYDQFCLAAPKGLLPIKSFQEMIVTIAALSRSSESLPDAWISLAPDTMEQIGTQLSADNENIDWRSFLLQAAQPWPMPTQAQLLSALRLFQETDQRGFGVVTKEQFIEVNHWLKEWTTDLNQVVSCDAEGGQQPPFSRTFALVETFFDIFADHSDEPPLLNYVDMLMYFSMAPDPFEGLLRALSVVTGQHMPRLAKKKLVQKKATTSEGAEDADRPSEDEAQVVWPEDIPQSAIDAKVTLDNLLKVILHGKSQHSESNRFILHPTSDAKEVISKERLANIFMDLGASSGQESLPLTVLLEHPIIQDLVYSHSAFKFVDLKPLVNPPVENPQPESSEYPIAV